jgi:phenylalanine ammonia-lyase
MAMILDGYSLDPEQVTSAATSAGAEVDLHPVARQRLDQSCELKSALIRGEQPIYGVTTGFGDSVSVQIAPAKSAELQLNIIRYHLNGTGPNAPDEVIRAAMLIRANCLARGNSGVTPAIVDLLLELLRHDVLPLVPVRGSVGASGDLVPLSYIASALIGEGKVRFSGEVRDAADVLSQIGLHPAVPQPKDSLALVNGTSFCSAYAVLAWAAAAEVAVVADICTALASEALLGNRDHFDSFIHAHKPHPGQVESARIISELLGDSSLALSHGQVVDANEPLAGRGFQRLSRSIQDRYSVRCAPHVIGTLRDTLTWVRNWLSTEINSSNDNPLFDAATGNVHCGGNFYGGHIAQAMDSLKLALANTADLLDRQVALLVDEKFNNGLTANLAALTADDDWEAGLHHGFKGMQIACSAITAEALKISGPAGIFSRSTEAHNQDKVSMASICARDAYAEAELIREVAAIQLLVACQALDLRGTDRMSPRTRAVHDTIREQVPVVGMDRRMDEDIARVISLIKSGAIRQAASGERAHYAGSCQPNLAEVDRILERPE